MSAPSDRDSRRLRDIAGALDRIARYTTEGRASLEDDRTYDAVLRCLTIVGEALGGLSDATYGQLASLPPGLPKAQRNLIVHEYWRIDPDEIWQTIVVDLPALRRDVEAL